MFRKQKVPEFSFQKTSRKLLNDRESIQRIKHLRSIIDNVTLKELKTFFRNHYSLIFSAFYDVFTNVQMDLQQKVNTTHYKELQNILGVFEKILILLPEYIQKKWQFNCISSIIKTLIHPTNISKVRLQGLQLFTIWFQILGNDAPKLCYDIYTSLVPILELLIKKTLYQDAITDSQRVLSDTSILVNEIEIKPVLTQNIDKESELEDDDQNLIKYLVRFIVTETIKIEWEENVFENRLNCQKFLFDKFKEYFLPVIFPKCNSDYTIDTNKELKLVSNEFLENYSPVPSKYLIEGSKICCYQEEVIRWLAELVNLDHPNLNKSNYETVLNSLELLEENKRDTFSSIKSSNGQMKSSSIDVFVKFDRDSLKVEGPMLIQMHEILFKNEENVNVINQLFQHAFYLPLQFYKAHLSVIYVYRSWLFSNLYKNLPFMLEEDSSLPVKLKSVSSFNDSINDGNNKVKISVTMQKVIFTNIGTVFLHTYKPDIVTLRVSPLKKPHQNHKQLHSDLIKKIILLIYRRSLCLISNLEHEHLINVLLDIGFNVLSCHSPTNRPDNHWITNDAIIGHFFQTLNFLILKSNLVTYISDEIWERYLNVYSSLTEWSPVIIEWEKTLDLLLKMLGKSLYNVDMGDLPLEKKEKRGRRAKKTFSSKPGKKLSINESDSILTAIHGQDPTQHSYKTDTMTGILNFNANTAFIEGLNQNTEDPVICTIEQRNNVNIKSESTKEMNQGESNRAAYYDNNEMDTASFVYSSHEETSSYLSAEDSSSPHCKDKNIESNAGIHSDSEFIPLSSSGGDTSMEGNCSFDNSIKQIYKDESEDLNIDADDESEGENIDNTHFEADSKTATLTRDESDVDLSTQLYRISTQDTVNDSSRTPTKHANRRKDKLLKRVERNSMNIEDNIVNAITDPHDLSNQIFTSDDLNAHHVLLGGTVIGWNQESAVLLWKRFVGLLGNITHIKNPGFLKSIFQYFLELTDSFIKMRENMCVPNGNQVTPSPPLFIPPIEYIIPWMFQALKLDSSFDNVKLVALKILCKITIRKLDIEPSTDHLAQFYKMIHSIIHSENKQFIYTLISNIGLHFFLMPLAGSEILILDFIKACKFVLQETNDVISNNDDIPKLEAATLLGSMLKFQKLNDHFRVFDSTSKSINIIDSGLYKSEILNILINSAKQEPLIAARSLSIICISFHCYSVLTSIETATSDLNDISNCILLLLSLMRFDNMEIATISVDMIRFLVNSCSQMQEKLPLIPEKIIQVLSWTINQTWLKHRKSINSSHKRFLTTSIFALVDWTMHLPLSQLLESNDLHSKGLIYLAFSALENVLKDNDFNCGVKTSSSSLKQNPTDKKVVTETKGASMKVSVVQQGNYNGLSIDPLIDYPSLFDVKSIQSFPEIEYGKDPGSNKFNELVKLAARVALCHLINNIGQYPKNNVLGGLSSCVQEHHDFQILKMKSSPDGSPENIIFDDLSQEVFNTSELQMFVVNGSMLVSFVTLNTKLSKVFNQSAPGGPPITKPSMENYAQESEVRLIIRDLCGKYCWDVTFVHKYDNNNVIFKCNEEQENMPPSPPPRRTLPSNLMNEKSVNVKAPKQQKPIIDYVDRLLSDLTENNPEIFSNQFPKPTSIESGQQSLEALSKRQIQEQNIVENNLFDNHHCLKISHPKLVEKKLRSSVPYENPPEITTPNSKFYFCRQILTQLGFLSWKRRASIDLIQKTNILRHLKFIDQRRGRETHKIAVLYVAWGQEDKESILGNTTGSLEFNTFINGIGWKVSLENHKGFMGGLESSGRNGCFAPYFANSTLEIMFHVSTWMPSEKPEDKQNKFKHLGNDEVMVIWSENYRDYRSHITKTEFGDVMIIIYPLRNSLFGIHIKTKSDVGTKFFGPLFDGAIVGEKELPVLVRSTAINAGRKIRECKQLYEEFFVERAKYLENAIKDFCEPMSFEDFAEHIYGIPTLNQDDSFQTNSPTEMSSDNNKHPGFTTNEYTSSLSNLDVNNKGRDSVISVDWSSIRVNDTVRK